MHVGITPAYRGSHGGYWALHNKDQENFGVTIHVVDTGVDTGAILQQVFTKPAQTDNFTTYPILQIAVGIDALKKQLHKALGGKIEPISVSQKGKIYYQPTVWEYFLNRAR
jgi:methionyl-tRNA formyltransferase